MPTDRCPYTGRKITVQFDDDLRHPGFYARGAFDPAIPFLDSDSAVDALSRRRGRVPKSAGVESLRCAYTGNPIGLDYRDDLWYAIGDFVSPVSHRYNSRELLLWDLGGRKGPRPRPPRVEVIGEREPPEANPNQDMEQSSGIAREAAEMFVG